MNIPPNRIKVGGVFILESSNGKILKKYGKNIFGLQKNRSINIGNKST
jgi:flagellum-specific peptidoglycan hydrolase FlgJ